SISESSVVRVRLRPVSTLFPYTTLFRSATKLRWYMGMHRFGHGEIVWMDRPHGSELVVRCVACEELTPSSEVELDHILPVVEGGDRKSTRLNSSHVKISYAVFCLKKKTD